jgi:hypothetical protein
MRDASALLINIFSCHNSSNVRLSAKKTLLGKILVGAYILSISPKNVRLWSYSSTSEHGHVKYWLVRITIYASSHRPMSKLLQYVPKRYNVGHINISKMRITHIGPWICISSLKLVLNISQRSNQNQFTLQSQTLLLHNMHH